MSMSQSVDFDNESIEDGISAQAQDATADEDTQVSEVEVTEEIVIKEAESETIEPNTFNIKPALQDKFKAQFVKNVVQEVLLEELSGKTYSTENAKEWTINIANIINKKVRDMKWKRYKHIVQVIIGEQRGAGLKSGVKCVWDSETDNYASEVFMNDSLFCVAVVFAIYFY